jgi:hypothetical protein
VWIEKKKEGLYSPGIRCLKQRNPQSIVIIPIKGIFFRRPRKKRITERAMAYVRQAKALARKVPMIVQKEIFF